MRYWFATLRLRYSPYWRGYPAGIAAKKRAHEKYLRLQEKFE